MTTTTFKPLGASNNFLGLAKGFIDGGTAMGQDLRQVSNGLMGHAGPLKPPNESQPVSFGGNELQEACPPHLGNNPSASIWGE